MYNYEIIKAIEKFDIYYKSEKIVFHDLEKKFINIFLNEKENNNLYVLPKENSYLIVLFIIYSGLVQYLNNIYSEGNNLIDEIKLGDILEYSKARCEFIGYSGEKIKLKFADGLIYTLPAEQIYKVSIYKGNAATLNKFPKNTNKGSKKTRNIISQIFDIDSDAFTKVISSSTLIVAKKDIIYSIIDNIKISYLGEMLDISEVFPMAYCLSEENYYYFKGNSSKQEPILKFTSKVYSAKDIIRTNKKISSVVVLQDKINREDFEDVVNISRKNNIKTIRLFLEPLEMEYYLNDDELLNNLNINNVNKNFFGNISSEDIDIINKNQYRLVKGYTNVKKKYISINSPYYDAYRKDILTKCRNLINIFQEDSNIIKFVINARTLIKRLLCMVVPLTEYEKFYENKSLKQFTIKSLLNELEKFNKSDLVESLSVNSQRSIEDIYNSCLELYEKEIKNSYKWNELETIIRLSNNQIICILVENKYIKKALRNYIKRRYPLKNNISIESLNIAKRKFYEIVIYTSKLDDNYYWNYNIFNSNKIIYIFHKCEKYNVKYLENRYNKFINKIEDAEVLEYISATENDYMDKKVVSEKEEIEEENNLNNELEMLIATSYIPSCLNNERKQSSITCQKVLVFQSGERAFITSQYEAYVLSESREEIINKKGKNIEKGDVILFIEEIDKDLIDNIMSDLLEISEINSKYNEDYMLVKQWKLEMKNYIAINDIKYNELENKLKSKGVSRCGATIRAWLLNSVVGPQDQEVLKALGEITSIGILKNNYIECYEACVNIRRFQVRIRKAIARCILKLSINEEEENLDLLIKNRIEESVNYIKKVEVESIYEVKKEIPIYLANKILEE